jgi:hypothetical protein
MAEAKKRVCWDGKMSPTEESECSKRTVDVNARIQCSILVNKAAEFQRLWLPMTFEFCLTQSL